MSVEFYNEYVKKQVITSFNKRHFFILRSLKSQVKCQESGAVLELGCGIGSLTYLISRNFKNLCFTSIDSSDKSIETATRIHIKNNKTNFICGNVTNLKELTDKKHNYVFAFDVFEHIEKESLSTLVKDISDLLFDNGIVALNIPNPYYLNHLKKNNTPNLQPIEEEIEPFRLIQLFKEHNVHLIHFNQDKIWKNNETHFYVFRKENGGNFGNNEIKLSVKEKIQRSIFFRKIKKQAGK